MSTFIDISGNHFTILNKITLKAGFFFNDEKLIFHFEYHIEYSFQFCFSVF